MRTKLSAVCTSFSFTEAENAFQKGFKMIEFDFSMLYSAVHFWNPFTLMAWKLSESTAHLNQAIYRQLKYSVAFRCCRGWKYLHIYFFLLCLVIFPHSLIPYYIIQECNPKAVQIEDLQAHNTCAMMGCEYVYRLLLQIIIQKDYSRQLVAVTCCSD